MLQNGHNVGGGGNANFMILFFVSKLLFFSFISYQVQVIEFAWKDVKSYEVDEEGMSFNFEYDRPGKKPRLVKIFTQYVSMRVF